ncbi:hypothetical protein Hdeb2414_s0023g00623121 [Helianthus debilis subsp. tardiflorus]
MLVSDDKGGDDKGRRGMWVCAAARPLVGLVVPKKLRSVVAEVVVFRGEGGRWRRR